MLIGKVWFGTQLDEIIDAFLCWSKAVGAECDPLTQLRYLPVFAITSRAKRHFRLCSILVFFEITQLVNKLNFYFQYFAWMNFRFIFSQEFILERANRHVLVIRWEREWLRVARILPLFYRVLLVMEAVVCPTLGLLLVRGLLVFYVFHITVNSLFATWSTHGS